MFDYRDTEFYHRWRAKGRIAPRTAEEARASDIYNKWWFYDAELFPGIVKEGIFPDYVPLPARMLLRNCDLRGCDCLDIGSMEGLIPILMKKQGAREVLATDFSFHCYDKMAALRQLHNVDFNFKKIGLLYDLASKIPERGRHAGFDLINLSGVLYHVFSPMNVIAGLRPLLKKNGLMIVTTNVINRDDYSMEFNNAGKLQAESNTFWYMSIKMLDYMLKYFQLQPIDHVYYVHSSEDRVRFSEGYDTGYLGVICRAITDPGARFDDEWITRSLRESWEYHLCDRAMMDAQPVSNIVYRAEVGSLDFAAKVLSTPPLVKAASISDTHCLKLADVS